MGYNVTQKIIMAHSKSGLKPAGEPLELKIDQTLTQDATGTMAWLQFEAIGLPRVKTDLSVSYVDHNTLQMGFRNPDDHQFLRTAAAKFGAVFSPAGTGICHQLHLENFALPGTTLLGSDSHTPTAGGMGALAMGAGGLSVALAMAGMPYVIPMPKVVKVELSGALKGFATAKDIILYLLGKLSVKGGVGRVFEYTGSGVSTLSVPERATITNMGAELGATSSIFPSDNKTLEFMRSQGRECEWKELVADQDALYDEVIVVDLNALEPLVAQPHMPDRVVTVASLAGLKVDQVSIGSCTNSSFADLCLVAQIWKDKKLAEHVDASISPGSKQVLEMIAREGYLQNILFAGARLLECACGPCIGMGGSPVSGGVSVRTFNRNFEGRSGTKDAKVYLVSPVVAAMLALHGKFTNPAGWGEALKTPEMPAHVPSIRHLFIDPPVDGAAVEIVRGPNIVPLEKFEPLGKKLLAEAVIILGDNITTDHIMPAGAEITSLRSNVPAIAEYILSRVDEGFVTRTRKAGSGIIVAGENYGQGSSREHAALAPRHLGIRAVLAKSLARIHRANLVNFGILPLTFANPLDYDKISLGAKFEIDFEAVKPHAETNIIVDGQTSLKVCNDLSAEELAIIKAGGLLNFVKH